MRYFVYICAPCAPCVPQRCRKRRFWRPGSAGQAPSDHRSWLVAIAGRNPTEQERIVERLIDRVENDVTARNPADTFHPTGIKAMACVVAKETTV